MIPKSTAEERLVAKWVFGVLFTLAAIGLVWVYSSRGRECARSCDAQGFAKSELKMRGGGRFEMGLDCVCAEPRAPRAE